MQHVRKIFYDSAGPLKAVLLGAVLTPGARPLIVRIRKGFVFFARPLSTVFSKFFGTVPAGLRASHVIPPKIPCSEGSGGH